MEKLTIKDLPKQVKDDMIKMISTSDEYQAIMKVRNRLLKERRYIEAQRETKRLKDIEDKTINRFLEKYSYIKQDVDTIVDNMNEEDQERLGAYVNGIVMLADVLETMIMESNAIFNKYAPDTRINSFDKLQQTARESANVVRMLDGNNNDEFYVNHYGDMTDNLCEMIVNKARSFYRKIKRHSKSKRA